MKALPAIGLVLLLIDFPIAARAADWATPKAPAVPEADGYVVIPAVAVAQ